MVEVIIRRLLVVMGLFDSFLLLKISTFATSSLTAVDGVVSSIDDEQSPLPLVVLGSSVDELDDIFYIYFVFILEN